MTKITSPNEKDGGTHITTKLIYPEIRHKTQTIISLVSELI